MQSLSFACQQATSFILLNCLCIQCYKIGDQVILFFSFLTFMAATHTDEWFTLSFRLYATKKIVQTF